MSDLLKALAVTAEVMGVEWSESAAALVVEELKAYPLDAVRVALKRCRCELARRLTIHDILDRLPGGHPGQEEAWGVVAPSLKNEQLSLVWTDEMREAYGVASGLAEEVVAARMAFKETYVRLVSEARAQQRPPVWTASLGWDPKLRAVALQDAVQKNKISAAYAARLTPPVELLDEDTTDLTKRIGNG
jgi:hypothetical protein